MRGCPSGDTAEAHDHCSVSASVNLLELDAGLS
jgi:hypothetical protein